MASIHTAAGRFTVPDGVARDYTAAPEPAPGPDESWTVMRLRQLARDRGVVYKGLHKTELLKALS
jgi:hypothetical protein